MAAFVSAAHGQEPSKPGPMQSGKRVGDDTKPAAEDFDVNKLFAGSCGWCHSKGGRAAGKGPMLMGTELTDAQIISRIRSGKAGQMPAFQFKDEQLQAIVAYIRALKPE
jgi:cytochrome c553